MSELHGFVSRKRRSLTTQPKTHPDPLTCPRCESSNTKFCYYNNYNKTQPRYFCKACKRHWTEGGILRNVPVGGGPKNKRLRRPVTAVVDQDNLLPRLSEAKLDESYTDIEELKGLVCWDFDSSRSFIKMFENDDDDLTSMNMNMMMSSCEETISDLSWNDLDDTMVLEDLNTLWPGGSDI